MATAVIGDIHGNLRALDDPLAQLHPLLAAKDTAVFLGDYIDRGPDTRGCIDRILRWQDESPATVITLLGNHEDRLLRLTALVLPQMQVIQSARFGGDA